MSHMSRRRGAIVAVLATLVALAGLTLAAPAQATEDTTVERVAGANRFATAAEAATKAYPGGATTVIIANGRDFPDALAAGGLAGSVDAPILLVEEDSVPQPTIDAITALAPTNIIILGGTGVVSQGIEDGLGNNGFTVTRVSGANRFETASKAAEETGVPEINGLKTVVLANGRNFADAVAISPGAHALSLPILLTDSDVLSPFALAFINDNDVEQVLILGGGAAVSDAIEAALVASGVQTERLAGANRYATSVAIANFHLANGFTAENIFLATGTNFADALGGGPLASITGGPLVLTTPTALRAEVEAFLVANADVFDFLFVFGGAGAVSDATVAAAAAAGQVDAPEGIQVAPATAEVIEANGTVEGDSPDDDRAFTVTNLDATKTYRITLVNAENIDTSGSDVVFADANDDDIADPGPPAGALVSVNGTAVNPAPDHTVGGVSPQGGQITFTVDGETQDELIPVVYEDPGPGGNTFLDLDDDNVPVDPFGLGGLTTFIPEEFTDGAPLGSTVTDKADDNSYATVGPPAATVYFAAGDTYRIFNGTFCITSTSAEFFQNLSADDNLQTVADQDLPLPAAYAQGGPNVFCLFDNAPTVPLGFAAAAGDPADTVVELDWMDSLTASVEGYNVYSNDETCADTDPAEFAMIGSTEAPTDGDPEFIMQGLTPDTDYCFAVTAVDGTDETAPEDTTDDITTAAPIDAPFITAASISNDTVPTGGGSVSDSFLLVFNEEMTAPVGGETITVLDADGDEFRIACTGVATADDETDADCLLVDGPDADGVLDTIGITLLEAGSDRNVGGGNDAFEYPAEIQSTDGITDADDGAGVDLAASTDTTIDA